MLPQKFSAATTWSPAPLVVFDCPQPLTRSATPATSAARREVEAGQQMR
jgi:hypothetical protein